VYHHADHLVVGPSPGGYQQPHNGYAHQYNQMPASAGGYGGGNPNRNSFMGQPPQASPYGGYPGYQG